jgi:hypothetical protein
VGESTRAAPATVPARMARKVPVSIRALAFTSSSSATSCGKMPNFTGPSTAEWVPSRNSATSMVPSDSRAKATAASTMMANSATLAMRTISVLSKRSASCPAVAENRKNGAMNVADTRPSMLAGSTPASVAWRAVIHVISALLNSWSLSAAESWQVSRAPRPPRYTE